MDFLRGALIQEQQALRLRLKLARIASNNPPQALQKWALRVAAAPLRNYASTPQSPP